MWIAWSEALIIIRAGEETREGVGGWRHQSRRPGSNQSTEAAASLLGVFVGIIKSMAVEILFNDIIISKLD